jgi:hypothetical protein
MKMTLTSSEAISDLEKYVSSFGFLLSKAAKNIFEYVEHFCEKHNAIPVDYSFFLLSCLETMPHLRSALKNLGGDPDEAILAIRNKIIEYIFDPYDADIPPYSDTLGRKIAPRKIIIDLSIAIAQKNLRKEIFDLDVFVAILEGHDDEFPFWENESWTDKRLHTPYNTLSHINATYDKTLDVKFPEILKGLDISELKESPIERAPSWVRPSLIRLFQDYPEYGRNCFLIMSFKPTKLHINIYKVLEDIFNKFNINLLRADMRSYSDDLLINVETYIYGCSFAIALFERLESDIFNPNVSFEVGYILALRKHICLVKEKTMPRLYSDIVGKLYFEFDINDLEGTLSLQIEKWLKDKKIIN